MQQRNKLFDILIVLAVLLSSCRSRPAQATAGTAAPSHLPQFTATLERPTAVETKIHLPAPTQPSPPPAPVALPAVSSNQAPGSIDPGVPLRIPRTRHTVTLLQNGKVLLAGGSMEPDDFVLDNELIDPATGLESWIAPLHTARHDHSATLLADGRVLVTGGYNYEQQWLPDAEIYDPATDTWTITYPLNSHGTSHTATLMKDGRVLVVGGCIGSGVCTERVDIFDPGTNGWVEGKPLFSERGGQAAVLLDDGRVLIAGGNTAWNAIPMEGTAVIYEPQMDTWITAGTMASPRALSKAAKLPNGDVLVAGGIVIGSDPPQTTGAVEIYHPGTNAWRTVASLSQARFAFILSALPDGRILVTGGSRNWDSLWNPDSFVREIEVFDPSTEQWSTFGELSSPSAFAAGTRLGDGRVWVSGGQVQNWVVDNTWLIQP